MENLRDAGMGLCLSACVVVATFMLSGCCGSAESDFEKLCNVEATCPEGFEPGMSGAEKHQKTSNCLSSKLRSKAGREYFAASSAQGLSPTDQAKLLRHAAQENGVKSCPDADRVLSGAPPSGE